MSSTHLEIHEEDIKIKKIQPDGCLDACPSGEEGTKNGKGSSLRSPEPEQDGEDKSRSCLHKLGCSVDKVKWQ